MSVGTVVDILQRASFVATAPPVAPSGSEPILNGKLPLDEIEPASVVDVVVKTPSTYAYRSVGDTLTKSILCHLLSSHPNDVFVSTRAVAPSSTQLISPFAWNLMQS